MNYKLLKKATTLCEKIDQQYNLLDGEDQDFFNNYHDIFRIQRDCADQVLSDIEYHLENDEDDEAEYYIKQLQATLLWCEAVIKLQEQTKKLPEIIFG